MAFKRLACIFVALVLVGCDAGFPTATPATTDPTPTQEMVTAEPTPQNWDMSCVEGNEAPLNMNPCLSPLDGVGTIADWEWVVEPNGNHKNDATGEDYTTEVIYENGYVFPLAGTKGERFAGAIGIELHGLELEAGQCYGAFFPGDLNVDDMNPLEFTDISFQAFVIKDDGSIDPLNVHGITYVGTDGIRRVDQTPSPFWTWWHRGDETVVLRMVINQNHANARMGNFFRPSAAYVVPVESGLCPGAAT